MTRRPALRRLGALTLVLPTLACGEDPVATPTPGAEPAVRAQVSYTVTSLGVMGGALPSSEAFAINNNGVIVGRTTVASGASHAFRRSGGVWTDLTSGAGMTGTAFDINLTGQIALTRVSAGQTRGFRWKPTGPIYEMMPTPTGERSAAFGINNAGTVVGYISYLNKPQAVRFNTSGAVTYLLMAGADSAIAYEIDSVGNAAGVRWYGATPQGVLWYTDGSSSAVPGGGLASAAYSLRAPAEVVGYKVLGPITTDAYTWSNVTGTTLLGILNPGIAWDISDVSRIVGQGGNNGGFQMGFSMRSGVLTWLPGLPASTDGVARGVNRCGTIVGSVVLATGRRVAVKWTPNFCD